MDFLFFFRINKKTIIKRQGFLGIIFTICTVYFIYFAKSARLIDLSDVIPLYILSVIGVNVFVFIMILYRLYFIYRKQLKIFELFAYIPQESIIKYQMQIVQRNFSSDDFIEFYIIGLRNELHFFIDINPDENVIWFTIFNIVQSISKFPKRAIQIAQKYKNE